MLARSVLFVPATRPELIAKIPRSWPDVAVVDLEDAVPPDAKAAARDALPAALEDGALGTPLFVRINAIGTSWWRDDVALAAHPALRGVVVPKLERSEQLVALSARLAAVGVREPRVIAGIETARGALDVRELLRPPVVAAYFGAEDLVADLGGERTSEGLEVLYARSRVALAAHAVGITAIDQAVVALDDEAAFVDDARAGARLGYQGKLCVHPRQVAWAHRAFAPSPEAVERSRRLVAAYDAAEMMGRGAIEVDGEMVDRPLVERARRILAKVDPP
jgi:citrate lyase subunit beta / citryl-CoA lyase